MKHLTYFKLFEANVYISYLESKIDFDVIDLLKQLSVDCLDETEKELYYVIRVKSPRNRIGISILVGTFRTVTKYTSEENDEFFWTYATEYSMDKILEILQEGYIEYRFGVGDNFNISSSAGPTDHKREVELEMEILRISKSQFPDANIEILERQP